MNDLLRRMRAAREHWIEIDDRRAICVLRPRFEEVLRLERGKSYSEFVRQFAIKWRGFTEADLLPSGGDIEAPFDADVCAEWMGDQPRVAEKVAGWLLEACNARVRDEAEAEKNSQSSSDGNEPPRTTEG